MVFFRFRDAVSGDTPSLAGPGAHDHRQAVRGGLWILNPIAATRELLDMVRSLEREHGPVKHVVLGTVAIEQDVRRRLRAEVSLFNSMVAAGAVRLSG